MSAPSLLLALLAALQQAPGAPPAHALALRPGERALSALALDFGADMRGEARRDDVLLALEQGGRRELRLVRSRPAGAAGPRFSGEPAWTLPLSPDVVAYAALAVGPDGARLPLLFNARGVFLARPEAPEEQRFERLLAADVLWQVPDGDELPHWQHGVVDLDGDGLEDLVVPVAGGYLVALQERGAEGPRFSAPSLLVLPGVRALAAQRGTAAPAELTGERGRLTLRLGEGPPSRSDVLVAVTDILPAPQLVDFDGNGRLDLMALDELFLHVWLHGEDGFAAWPSFSLESPVRLDSRRQLDVSWSAHAADISGDGRSDVVLVASDQRSKDVRTQVLVFTQGAGGGEDAPLFGKDGTPAQVLVLAGFVGDARLEDVDGDGLPDLVLSTVRPDLLETLLQAASDRLETELLVYRNEGGRLARRPTFAHRVRVRVEEGAEPLARFARPGGTRGLATLLVREEAGRLQALGLRAGRDGAWSVLPRPLWELGLHPEARLVPVPGFRSALGAARGAPPRGVLALEPGQVLFVELP